MEIKEYQQKAERTLARTKDSLTDDLHMILGIFTEGAEIADAYKKYVAYNKKLDLINIKEEIGDILFYIANLCNLHGWDLRDIMDTNIKKLEARFPDKFSQEKALNRDLDTERKILER